MCTFVKLFPSQAGGLQCQGNSSILKECRISALSFLKEHNISTRGKEATISDLIVNKITSEIIEVSKLDQVDICDCHRRGFTYKHKSLKQKNCAMKDCTNVGEKGRPRVSFEASYKIYQEITQHVPVGSILCCKHRRQFQDVAEPHIVIPCPDQVTEQKVIPVQPTSQSLFRTSVPITAQTQKSSGPQSRSPSTLSLSPEPSPTPTCKSANLPACPSAKVEGAFLSLQLDVAASRMEKEKTESELGSENAKLRRTCKICLDEEVGLI